MQKSKQFKIRSKIITYLKNWVAAHEGIDAITFKLASIINIPQ